MQVTKAKPDLNWLKVCPTSSKYSKLVLVIDHGVAESCLRKLVPWLFTIDQCPFILVSIKHPKVAVYISCKASKHVDLTIDKSSGGSLSRVRSAALCKTIVPKSWHQSLLFIVSPYLNIFFDQVHLLIRYQIFFQIVWQTSFNFFVVEHIDHRVYTPTINTFYRFEQLGVSDGSLIFWELSKLVLIHVDEVRLIVVCLSDSQNGSPLVLFICFALLYLIQKWPNTPFHWHWLDAKVLP